MINAREYTSAAEMLANAAAVRRRLVASPKRKHDDGIMIAKHAPKPTLASGSKQLVIPVKLVDAKNHVSAFLAWKAIFGLNNDPEKDFQGMCILAGLTADEVRDKKSKSKRYVLIRQSIIRTLATRYRMTSTELGEMINRTCSTVLEHIGTKGRNHPTPIRDKRYFGAKLSLDEVAQIRKRFGSGESARALAREFKCDRSNIYHIARGRTFVGVANDGGKQ